LDGNHYTSIAFLAFPTTFAATTKTNIRRSVGYWITDKGSGTTSFFQNVQTIKTIGTH
jgi:hypothetical protein